MPVFIPQLTRYFVWGKMVLLAPFNPYIRIYLDFFVFMEMCEIQRHGKCVRCGDVVYTYVVQGHCEYVNTEHYLFTFSWV